MIYKHQNYEIDLTKVTRLYPAALISAGGESALVSLEWAQMKEGKIVLESYVLVCDCDPVGEVPVNRIEVQFETKEALIEVMNEIARMLNEKN